MTETIQGKIVQIDSDQFGEQSQILTVQIEMNGTAEVPLAQFAAKTITLTAEGVAAASDFAQFIENRFPVKSAKDLKIEDLELENAAAFRKIQILSRAIFELGYDPTIIR